MAEDEKDEELKETNDGQQPEIKNAEFSPLANEENLKSEKINIDSPLFKENIKLLLDVPMDVSVELGRSKRSVEEILSLGEGSIIELNRLAGEAIDLLVNGKIIAKGEVVVIDENFGIRITSIVSQEQRIIDVNLL